MLISDRVRKIYFLNIQLEEYAKYISLKENSQKIAEFANRRKPGPEVIKLFPCLTQPRMNFFLLINVKMPTIVGILTFMSGKKLHSSLI